MRNPYFRVYADHPVKPNQAVPFLDFMAIGAISALKAPAAWAAPHRCCDWRANISQSSLKKGNTILDKIRSNLYARVTCILCVRACSCVCVACMCWRVSMHSLPRDVIFSGEILGCDAHGSLDVLICESGPESVLHFEVCA